MLLGTVGVSYLGNILACRGEIAKKQDRGINRPLERFIRTGYGSSIKHKDF